MAGSSSSNSGYPYAYPSHVCAPNFVTVKLSGRDMYDVWKTQMLCLLKSHDMVGFVDGTLTAENMGKEKDMLWRRSDALATAWILGSLSEQTLKYVTNILKPFTDFTAKDVWDKLQTIYGPLRQHKAAAAAAAELEDKEGTTDERPTKEIEKEINLIKDVKEEKRKDTEEEERAKKERAMGSLYAATLRQAFWSVKGILSKNRITMRDSITINGNTALHVAVSTTKNRVFLEKMLNLARPPLDMRNSEGSTLLHVAAIVGNTEAAKMLVEKNPELLHAVDKENQTPLARALSNMHTDTYLYLLQCNKDYNVDIEAAKGSSWALLVNIISSKDYSTALTFYRDNVKAHKMPLTDIETVLMAIAQNFPTKLNRWERMLADSKCLFTFLDYHFATPPKFKFVEAIKRKEEDYRDAKHLLRNLCSFIKSKADSRSQQEYYNNVILEATRQNEDKVVEIIVSKFPNAIWSTNEDGHNIIQYAVINRSEKVYNLLYQMSEHRNMYKTIKDPSGNNLLHLAARLAPPDKLNHISGAALQIQSELQWFKEVEGFVCPLNIMQKNWFDETPQMVFTNQHKDLVVDGEKWMKETAQSYTITAALITTIVFAAAITVPGGNKQDIGIPEFTNKSAFTVFAISDAISLFTSVTSLLMFLSILTARFSEEDFLFKLPTKLIIGLTTLIISTAAMLVAFGATLFLMFCQNNPQILIPIAALTCLPITCFVTLQFPLIKDVLTSTYGRSIFGKKSDRLFY